VTSPEPPAAGASRIPLRIGQVPGVTTTKWRRIWAERFPRSPLEVVDLTVAGQRGALVDEVVDLGFLRLPVDADGLHVIRLYDEVPVVVAPKEHPVSAFEEVGLADLAGEPLMADDGTPAVFDRVAWGQGLLLVPLSLARTHSRRDLVHRPVHDATPTTIALVWRADTSDPRVEEFIGIVRVRTPNSSRTAASRAAREPASPQPRPTAAGSKRKPSSGGRTTRRRGRQG